MNNLNGLLSIFGKKPIETKECFGASVLEITVPNPSHKLFIAISQKGDINEPHVHVFRSDSDAVNWVRGIPLSLIRNKYIIHNGSRVNILSNDELSEINHVMRKRTDVEILSQRLDITNWRYIMNTWNEYNKDLEVDVSKYKIPLYDFKTIGKGKSMI